MDDEGAEDDTVGPELMLVVKDIAEDEASGDEDEASVTAVEASVIAVEVSVTADKDEDDEITALKEEEDGGSSTIFAPQMPLFGFASPTDDFM